MNITQNFTNTHKEISVNGGQEMYKNSGTHYLRLRADLRRSLYFYKPHKLKLVGVNVKKVVPIAEVK